MSYRKNYIEKYGEIPGNKDIHHILPKRLNGTDEADNLVALTRKEHSDAHLLLYEKYGDIKDLCAYYLLKGEYPLEVRKKCASEGGKIGGKRTAQEKTGIHGGTPEQRSEWGRAGGKVGGRVQAEQGLGFHKYKTDPELHRKWASKGGIACGAFQNSKFQAAQGRKGGKKNKGYLWLNDGEKSIKYTKKMQSEQSVEDFLKMNTTYRKGRIMKSMKRKENENN